MSQFRSAGFCYLSAILLITACNQAVEEKQTVAVPERQTPNYQVDILVPGSPFHGIHGITFDLQDQILAGSVVGMSIYAVDPQSGQVKLDQGPPEGQADDLEVWQDGTLAWTAFMLGNVYSRSPAGELKVLASGLPGINSIAYKQDGRLFATQVFLGDALYEIDTKGEQPARKIIEGMGGLNGFDFGPDGLLYGPLWFKGQVVRIDVDSGELSIVAEGFKVPAAVNFDSKGNLHVIDNETGEIFQVDIETGEKTLIATAPTNLDNLAFDSNDNLYITNMSDNAIYEVMRDSGELRLVVGGPLTTPAGIDLVGNTLYVADTFTLSKVNTDTGSVTDISRIISDHEYPIAVSASKDSIIMASSNAGMVQGYSRETEIRTFRWLDFQSPAGVYALDDGSVIVAETAAGRVLWVTPGDTDRKVIIDGLLEPMGLTMQGTDTLYVSEAGGGRIIKINLKSNEQQILVVGLNDPEGIDLNKDGNLLVAEVGEKRVIMISGNGTITPIAENLPIGLKGYPGLPASFLPTGLSVADDGTIYLSSDIDNSILKITPRRLTEN